MNTNFNDNPFSNLLNEQLSSVIFVQDYLQLDFDGNVITYYSWPTVNFENRKYTYTDLNYKNALCGLIAKNVTDVYFEKGSLLKIIYETNDNIELIFKDIDKEAIYYVTATGEWSST